MADDIINKNELLELRILEQVEKNSRLTTRMIAAQVGCNIRLTHALLKKLISKGLLEVRKLNSRHWDYFLTPSGIMEKAKRTYKFFEISMQFYKEARERSALVCKRIAEKGKKNVGFIGAGTLAEIVYLSCQEYNLNLVKVFDLRKKIFLGRKVLPLENIDNENIDALILCVYNPDTQFYERYKLKKYPDLYKIFT